jgi:hypothetical protein
MTSSTEPQAATAPVTVAIDSRIPGQPHAGTGGSGLAQAQIARARQARAEGDRSTAADIVAASLRAGLWTHRRLWVELVSLMERSADYERIRSLWWESPDSCHQRVALLRSVARAASVAGEHDDARVLLRKAIVVQAGRGRRLRSRLGRSKRWVLMRMPVRAATSQPFDLRAATALADLNEELSERDVRAFLISGSLLGCIRESRFISWDKDIDVGVFRDDIQSLDLERAFDRSSTFHVRRLDFNTDRLRVNHTNGVAIDIFPHYREDDVIWHDGTATRWWNRPFGLKRIDFLGDKVFVPDLPEQYLDDNYGNWRVPVPDFDARLDAPNVEVTDPDYFHTLLFFSLLDAVVKGSANRRRRYRTLLRDRGEGDWLSRV